MATRPIYGTTTGRLFAPGQGENGTDFDADLSGTWTDTFLRDVPFTATRNRLHGEGTFSGTTIRTTLVR